MLPLRRTIPILLPISLIIGGVRLLIAQSPYGPGTTSAPRLRAWDHDSILVAGLVRADAAELAYARAALPTLTAPAVLEYARGLVVYYSTDEATIAPLAGRFHVPMLGQTTTAFEGTAVTDSQYLAQTIRRQQRLLATLPIAGIQDAELRQRVLQTRQEVQRHLDEGMRLQLPSATAR